MAQFAPAEGGGHVVAAIAPDQLGQPLRLIEDAGGGAAVSWQRVPLPFGATHALAAEPLVEEPTRLPGQYEDAATGLHYNYWRDYDPRLGRYLQPDPIGLAGGDVNLYAYVWNDPLSWSDPEGLAADILVDAALIGYDLGRIIGDNIVGDCGNLGENALALGLDVIGAIVPFATGLGPTYRLGKNVNKGGETAATKAGRQAHREFEERVRRKPGWQSQPQNLIDPATGRKVVPDAVTPSGRPVELKPNTTSGRKSGAIQLPHYERALGRKGRVIYYDP